MAFWNKKSKPLNKVPTDVPYDGLESKFKEIEQERDKYPQSASSGLFSGGMGALGSCIIGPYSRTYSAPSPVPASTGIDPMSLLICKEGNAIVLKSSNHVPLYKLSKLELKQIAPKDAISIASILLLFLEESEKLENND